ncbi:hypothetical protein [Enterovibrio norvegicus]|uniref:hypothetical protein n=1 Tax=Enterovibrio norvegicus TaxID=188144 RepID=UPI00352D9067
MSEKLENRIREYHATWIAAAKKGMMSFESASMLIDAFELGAAEALESQTEGATPVQISDTFIKQAADSRQFISNSGGSNRWAPCRSNVDSALILSVKNELETTVNFRSRAIHASVKRLSD